MTKRQFGSEVFDKLLEKINIPADKRILVCRDLKDKVCIATLEAIDTLLGKVGKK